MNRPCPNAVPGNCPGTGNPLSNYSSEAPDGIDYITTEWQGGEPPFGQDWTATECGKTFVSNFSQLDADLQSLSEAQQCNMRLQYPNPVNGFFFNQPESATVKCDDGSPFTYTVPAGLFIGINQAQADSFAESAAKRFAMAHRVCLSDLDPDEDATQGQEKTYTVTATGNTVINSPGVLSNDWEIIAGSLPPGMDLKTPFTQDGVAVIKGTPTSAGDFDFTLQIITPSGDRMQKDYTITVDKSPLKLSAYWTFDETAGSFVDNVAGYSIPRDVMSSGQGCVGHPTHAVVFPNNSGYIAPPSNSGPSFVSTDSKGFSAWFWFFYDHSGGPLGTEIDINISPTFQTGHYLDFYVSGGSFSTTFHVGVYGNGVNQAAFPVTINVLTCTFLGMTWDKDSNLFHIYVNGVSVGSFPAAGMAVDDGNLLVTLQSVVHNGNQLNMDEFGFVVGGPISDAQMASLFNGGSGVTWPQVKSIIES